MKCITYKRARCDSHEELAKALTRQEQALREYIDEHNVEVTAEFTDESLLSAGDQGRPGLRAALKYCKRGKPNALLVVSCDRISRDLNELLGLQRELSALGVRIIYVQGEAKPLVASDDDPVAVLPFTSNEIGAILSALNQRLNEFDRRSSRTMDDHVRNITGEQAAIIEDVRSRFYDALPTRSFE
jgi:DNA invertase Pin-like site-specific DNA recombinase